MLAHDYHSLWLNSAALARAGGDLDVEGGVVERDASGEPTGVLREEAAGGSAIGTSTSRTTSTSTRCARACARGGRGVTAVHDKDGWLGALRLWQPLAAEGALTLRGLAVAARRARRRAGRRSGCAAGSATGCCGSAT